MFKKIALVVLCALVLSVVAVLGFAATKPDTFHIARSTTIKAPPERIFPLINDLRSNVSWSPFEKDPAMKRSFGNTTVGKGASYTWDGNVDVGAGSIEITEATPPSKVAMRLNMVRPLEAHHNVEFTLEPTSADTTKVTWAMFGEQPFLGKIVSVFMDCDKMVGSEFDKGLASLKALVEGQSAQLRN
jgi:uncharacterized protein YndB with AHSA1/START domain